MNIGFPKAQDSIAALFEVGIAGTVTLNVCLLDRIWRGRVQQRVAVPKIAIPLDNNTMFRQKYIDNEFTADDLLFKVDNIQSVENGMSSTFKPVCFFAGGKTKYAIDASHIGRVVTTGMRAIFNPSFQSPSGNIKWLTTCFTLLDLTASPNADSPYPGHFFGFARNLPCVCTVERTEGNGASATRDEGAITLAASKGTAIVAAMCGVGPWQECFVTFIAWAKCACDVINILIIPWSVAL